jgi:hypothetical protein
VILKSLTNLLAFQAMFHGVEDYFSPSVETALEPIKMGLDICEWAIVGKKHRLRVQAAHPLEAEIPLVEVDIGWWRGRKDVVKTLKPDCSNIACEHARTLRIVKNNVVRGMAGCVEDIETPISD